MRSVIQARVPVWELAEVSELLSLAPFEPNDEVTENSLSVKVAFLLAIMPLKGVEDMQVLSVALPPVRSLECQGPSPP